MSDKELWKIFADEKRRNMLILLSEKEMTPSEISEKLDLSPSLISNNLRLMKLSDLVHERKEGQKVIYSINKTKGIPMFDFLANMFDYNLKALKQYSENKKRVAKR